MAINNLIIDGNNNSNPNGPKGPQNPQGPNNNGGNGNNLPPKGPINMANVKDSGIPDELVNYNELAKKGKFHQVEFRDKELTQMLSVLKTLNHPNVLLTGDAGVGKTALAKQLALDLVSDDDNLTKSVLDKDTIIYELPLTNLIAGGSLVGQIEKRIKNILTFAEDEKNHAILYLDEIHQLFSSGDVTMQNVAQQLKPALANPDLHVIASTTKGESLKLKKDPAFRRRFSEVLVPELTDAQTKTILQKLIPTLAKHHEVSISDDQFEYLIEKANEYAPQVNSHRPDSAITLLDRAASDTHIRAIEISKQLNQPVSVLPVTKNGIDTAADHLINLGADSKPHQSDKLKERLNAHIINQDKAKKKLVSLINRQQLHLTKPIKPASFLFAGPTGTGKTEMVKQLTKSLYGDLKPLITLNMTEYASNASVSRLIGSSRGYVGYDSTQPLPLDSVATNPYHIILLDEFEKAAPAVKRLFMQVLDEGSLDDNRGQHLDFSHSIVIATTNAGSDVYDKDVSSIGFSDSKDDGISQSELLNALKMSFPIELLNRFEDIILFNALSKDDYKKVLKIQYNDFLADIEDGPSNFDLTPKVLDLDKDYEVIDKLSDKSYNKMLNGRPAKKVIHNYVENQIIRHMNDKVINLMAIDKPVVKTTDKPNENEKSNIK